MSKSVPFRSAPPHIRAAIRQQADRWETTNGVPLANLLPSEGMRTENPDSEFLGATLLDTRVDVTYYIEIPTLEGETA